MFALDHLDSLFVITSFLFQIILIVHFALRKWRFNIAMRYGPIVYALSIPAVVVSVLLLLGGKDWSLWLSGFLYMAWAGFGFTVEYVMGITEWRSPIRWPILIPFVFLYLAAVMFYWWPLAIFSRPLWFVYAALFMVATVLNVTSHKKPQDGGEKI